MVNLNVNNFFEVIFFFPSSISWSTAILAKLVPAKKTPRNNQANQFFTALGSWANKNDSGMERPRLWFVSCCCCWCCCWCSCCCCLCSCWWCWWCCCSGWWCCWCCWAELKKVKKHLNFRIRQCLAESLRLGLERLKDCRRLGEEEGARARDDRCVAELRASSPKMSTGAQMVRWLLAEMTIGRIVIPTEVKLAQEPPIAGDWSAHSLIKTWSLFANHSPLTGANFWVIFSEKDETITREISRGILNQFRYIL